MFRKALIVLAVGGLATGLVGPGLLPSSARPASGIVTPGEHQIIVGLGRAVVGMGVGEEKRVTVAPEETYGAVDPDALAEVPREIIPADTRSAGQDLVTRSPDGSTRVVRVKEVREGTVLLDLNHPLAGMTLHVAVRVIGIDDPAPP